MSRSAGLLFFAFLFFSSPVFAAAKIQEVDASNGAKAWLIEDHNLPIVTVRVDFADSGAAYDPKDKEGLAFFVTQMLNEGAGEMDSLALNRALEKYAIRFGVDMDEDTISVSLQALSEFKGHAFDLLSLMLNKPRFDNDAVERVRANIVSDLKQLEADPSYSASLHWKAIAFAGHPYSRPKRGTPDSIEQITRTDLQQYDRQHLLCSARRIEVVGDITAAETREMLAKLFPSFSCASGATPVRDVKIRDGGAAPIMVKEAVPQTVITASLPGVMRSDPRYYALVVLNQVFGGGVLTSRLGLEIREKRGLAYYAESDVDALEHGGWMSIHFATRREQAGNAIRIFMDEVEKMRKKGITEAELDAAKLYLTGSFSLGLDSQEALADYMAAMQRYRLGMDYLDRRNDKINAVTLSEVNTLAKDIFSHKPLVVTVGQ